MKFYPRDWRGDQALRAISIAARGMWMECLCIMHEAKPYGHLVLNGKPVGDDALARMTGVSVDEVSALMAELRQAGAFSVTREGIIFSRRMTKDHARAGKGRKAVQKRWAQTVDNKEVSGTPNRLPNRNPITQKPEAREKEELCSSKKKGCRIPDDFMPDIAWAKAQGLPEQSALLEAEKFRNFWQAKSGAGATKLDWPATWRSWVLNSLERRGIERTAKPQKPDSELWQTRLASARKLQSWPTDEFGPKPGQDGCRVPKQLIQPGDGEGWGEWKRSAA